MGIDAVTLVVERAELDPGTCGSPLPHAVSNTVTPARTPIQVFPIAVMVCPSAAKAIHPRYRRYRTER
jgi:hypothetical protein